ncbi:MAG: hypothetical protein NWS85_09690 [Hydrogenophaga sp.]|nr:hypothetical protein [Hydrogenophaga sp.]
MGPDQWRLAGLCRASYEDSKPQLVNAVLAAERSAYIQSLLKAAKIE